MMNTVSLASPSLSGGPVIGQTVTPLQRPHPSGIAMVMVMILYDECIKDCDKAVERGRELRADLKMISRALTRKGIALVKLAKTSKDFDIAIETFQKALTEHRNPDTKS